MAHLQGVCYHLLDSIKLNLVDQLDCIDAIDRDKNSLNLHVDGRTPSIAFTASSDCRLTEGGGWWQQDHHCPGSEPALMLAAATDSQAHDQADS